MVNGRVVVLNTDKTCYFWYSGQCQDLIVMVTLAEALHPDTHMDIRMDKDTDMDLGMGMGMGMVMDMDTDMGMGMVMDMDMRTAMHAQANEPTTAPAAPSPCIAPETPTIITAPHPTPKKTYFSQPVTTSPIGSTRCFDTICYGRGIRRRKSTCLRAVSTTGALMVVLVVMVMVMVMVMVAIITIKQQLRGL